MSSTAAKAPTPTMIIIHNAKASQGAACRGGKRTPLVHSFGSFHTYSLSWNTLVRQTSLLKFQITPQDGAWYLKAALARPLYFMVVVFAAAWTSGGALPQEVEGTTIAGSRQAGAFKKKKKNDCEPSDNSGTKAPVAHLGTDRPPRSDFSGLQRMLMTVLRPWSHDAVACRDLWGKALLSSPGNSFWASIFCTPPVVEVDVWDSSRVAREQVGFGVDAVQDGIDGGSWKQPQSERA